MKWFEMIKNKRNVSCQKEKDCCKDRQLRRDPREKSQAPIKILEKDRDVLLQMEKDLVEVMDALGDCRDVDLITDALTIASYGLLKTPILVIEGQVVSSGTVLDKEKFAEILAG